MDKPIKILLVEDNPVDVLIFKETLKESLYADATLLMATSLAQASMLSKENILLVLLDLRLPDSSGLNTVKQIHKYFPDSAIIIITALEDEKIAIATLKQGAQNYLYKKELNHNVLDRTIRYSLERHQIIQQLKTANEELLHQNKEKGKREDELIIANEELVFQNEEKEKRAAELIIANKELVFQNEEKEKRAAERRFATNNLNALINNTNDLMWSVDKNFKLITSNQPFNEIVRLMSGKIITQGCDILSVGFPEEQTQRYKAFYERAFTGEPFTETEYNDTPVEFWSEISFYPIRKGKEIIGTACHSRNITERMRAEKKLEQSEAHLAEAQRLAKMGSWNYDIKSDKLMWSEELYHVFDIERIKFLETYNSFLLLIDIEDKEIALQSSKHTQQTGEPFTLEYHITTAKGEKRIIQEYGYGERDGDGKIIRLFGTAQDITERKNAETEREKITADIIQRNKDLEQFSYIISHNLRAPVANIIGLSDIARVGNLKPGQQKEIMEGLSFSATKLDEVIIDLNNILKVKRELNEKKEIVHLSLLANDIHGSIENLVEKEKVFLSWDFTPVDEILTLKGYMHSIFYNLILNSIKYHRPGIPPVIEIKSLKLNDKIVLIFKDNGMGIDLEKKGDQVFGLYKRFHTDSAEGKGMGLYMVRTQVEALGGKISVESEVNKGATFKIEFKA